MERERHRDRELELQENVQQPNACSPAECVLSVVSDGDEEVAMGTEDSGSVTSSTAVASDRATVETTSLPLPAEPLAVTVYGLDGEILIRVHVQETEELTVWQLKQQIHEARGTEPYCQQLVLGNVPLEDTDSLKNLNPDGLLDLQLVVQVDCSLALGQEVAWGAWENMSSNSGPLPLFAGTWQALPGQGQSPRLQQLEIHGGDVTDGMGGQQFLRVCNDDVFLEHWRLTIEGNILRVQGGDGRDVLLVRV